MIYWLSLWLQQYYHGFQVFQYPTLRILCAALTSLFIALWFGPSMITWLKQLQIGQSIRDDGPKSHLSKAGTPTMGGVLVLVAVTISLLLWGDLTNKYLWLALLVMLGFGVVGWVDDHRKVVLKNSKGLPARWKYFWQSLIGLALAGYLFFTAQSPVETQLIVPFFKNIHIALGVLFILLTYFVVVGSSNAVNLTDGLDGLAILPIVLVSAGLGIFAYLTGNSQFSEYLNIPYVDGVGELSVFCSALMGAGLGFLWFNSYPAEVFMGDVGSLALGAALGTVAVAIRQEILLFIMGGVFVAETVSVILQVGYFKMTRERIFRMAPLHHHFELKGWAEPKVIVRFWIITVILVILGLMTLKIR